MNSQISQLPPDLDQIAQICSTTAWQLQQCAQRCRQLGRQVQQVLEGTPNQIEGGTCHPVNTNFAPSDLDLFGHPSFDHDPGAGTV